MSSTGTIREGSEVIGADGAHMGAIDHVDGHWIKLTKDDRGQHHYVATALAAELDESRVGLCGSSRFYRAR